MTTHELFQSKKPLRNWWALVVDDPQFAEVLLHARSEFMESGPNEAQLAGARAYEILLTGLAAAGLSEEEMPSPGLHHQIEQEPPPPHAPAPTPKPQPKQVKAKRK